MAKHEKLKAVKRKVCKKMDIPDNPNSGYHPKSLVKLNVGGKIFMTTQGTLFKVGD